MIIRRGILLAFDSGTYTAEVLLFEATSCALNNVPVANAIDRSSALSGCLCAVLFFDEHNPQDAVVIATFANDTLGLPSPPAGRVAFNAGHHQIINDTLSTGSTRTYSITGSSTGLPIGITGIVYTVIFSSTSANAALQLAPHGADITSYVTIGNLPAANTTMTGSGILPVSTTGQIDIKAINGLCTINLYTYGYSM